MESSGPREKWEIPFVEAQGEGPSLVTSDVKWVMAYREETMPVVVF
jgi:ABC-type protease/lipase transport system fused ATPase/permease subunit